MKIKYCKLKKKVLIFSQGGNNMLKEIQRNMLINRLIIMGVWEFNEVSIFDMSIKDLTLTLAKEENKNDSTEIQKR